MGRERRDLVALYNIAVAVGSSLNLKEVIWRLYKEASRSIDPSNFAIVIYDEHRDKLTFYLVYDQLKAIKPFALKHSTNRGLISQVLNTKKHQLIDDLAKKADKFELNRLHPDKLARSWLGVPFFNSHLPNQNAQGVIAIWSYKPNAYSQRDLWFLSEIATQAAIAIRNANLFEASQRRLLEMSVVNDVAKTLSSTLELEKVLHRIMDQVEEMLNVSAGFLLLKDPITEDLLFQIGLGQTKNIKPFRIPKGKGVAGHVAVNGKALHVEKKQHPIDFNARNLLCVPLVLHDQVIGVLEVLNKKEGHFSQHDLELLSSVASFAGIAIENARLHESVLNERDRVIDAEEEARKALARDLHDGPVQLVSSLSMRLNFCLKLNQQRPELLPNELPQAMKLAERAVHQMRTMLFELRPLALEVDGLEAALRTFIDRQQQDITEKQFTRLTLSIETDNPQGHLTRQDIKVEGALFAIVQEAVTNAIKHAQSSYINVQLKETPTAIYTIITDDGVGFRVDETMNTYSQRGSLGMLNIKERTELIGGDLAIRSVSGKGTKIRVFVPKAQKERLKKRGQSGILSNSRRVHTGMLSTHPNGTKD